MPRVRASIAARLVLGYGLLAMLSIMVVAGVFYVGTVGVLDRNTDSKIAAISERLMERYRARPLTALAEEVRVKLSDGIDSEREIFLVVGPDGTKLAGNLSAWPANAMLPDGLFTRDVARGGQRMPARLLARRLPLGGLLVVGRDLSEQDATRLLVWRSLATGIGLSLLLTVCGAFLFRSQIEGRIGEIRRTAHAIGAGDLSRRLPVAGDDEFSLLNQDINRMLDRIERLMDGVRHVSNAIAHDLRTPLGRIRGKLEDAVSHQAADSGMARAARGAIEDIDDLILLFERLLQIAEAESGVRAQLFECVELHKIAADMVDMYEATAEDQDIALAAEPGAAAWVQGERNLLASAVASLIDNAIKYAGKGALVRVRIAADAAQVAITVQDNGPGIPAAERANVLQRFYRLDKSRSVPGNGLGLSIVAATASLHGGMLELADAGPGLAARILLPRLAPALAGEAVKH
jgi:signal transduction histidine kinase